MISSQDKIETRRTRFSRTAWITVIALVVATAALALFRVGLLDLPRVPSTITSMTAGLSELDKLKDTDAYLRAPYNAREMFSSATPKDRPHCVWKMRAGVNYIGQGDVEYAILGLQTMRDGLREQPDNLAMGNAYRMESFKLRRAYLNEARTRGEVTPKFPSHLERQPIAFLEELVHEHPSRETKLQLALAWVDEMLLFPALEIKAPSSVQSVDILTEILEEPDNEYYVPALFARGLNHLHRPARLVWPETNTTPLDAAVQDIAKCVAIGRKLNVGSERLQSTLAMALGDAYVKAGRLSVARSWWQIAQNLCHDDDIQQAVRRRYAWNDEEILDRLEEELDRARLDLDRPMTDLAMMWN